MQNRIRSSLGLGCAVYLLSSCMLMLLPLEGCQNLFLAAGYSAVFSEVWWLLVLWGFLFLFCYWDWVFHFWYHLWPPDKWLDQCLKSHFSCFFVWQALPIRSFHLCFSVLLTISLLLFFFFLGLILFLSFLCIIMFSLKPPFLSATAVTPPVWLSLQLPHVYVGSTFSPLSPGQEVCVLPAPRQAHGGTQEVPVPPHVWCVCWTVICLLLCFQKSQLCRGEIISGLEIWLET